MGKSYIELWNIIVVPNPNLSSCASMYRIKPERTIKFFFAKTNFYAMSSIKNRKIPYGKEVAKVWN